MLIGVDTKKTAPTKCRRSIDGIRFEIIKDLSASIFTASTAVLYKNLLNPQWFS
jgi:hypothetical protein